MIVQANTAGGRYFVRKGVCGASLLCFGQKETDLPIDHRHLTPGESNSRRNEIGAVMAWGLNFRRSDLNASLKKSVAVALTALVLGGAVAATSATPAAAQWHRGYW